MAEVTTELTDKNQIIISPDSQEASKEKENEYIKLVNKKIRTLNKKLNINIANIEKKKRLLEERLMKTSKKCLEISKT